MIFHYCKYITCVLSPLLTWPGGHTVFQTTYDLILIYITPFSAWRDRHQSITSRTKTAMASFSSSNSIPFLFSCLLLLLVSYLCVSEAQGTPPIANGLSLSFFDTSCPKLESIVRKQLEKDFKQDIGQAAGLLRLHFHDCFVQVPSFIYSAFTIITATITILFRAACERLNILIS